MSPTQQPPRPLNISIVGAGIGGLAAAIALRRHGHLVTIFETSQAKTEIGAGITVQRNALRILESFEGFTRQNLNAAQFDGVVIFDAESGTGTERPLPEAMRSEARQSLSCHRNDLHRELRRLATDETVSASRPAKLLLDTKVIACDAATGTVTLAGGEIIAADVVIGADGIRSVVRTSILGHVVKPPASGWTCFRCLFDASNIRDIEELKWFTEGMHGARNVRMPPRDDEDTDVKFFFTYPCRNGTLVNFVGFYADSEQESEDWSSTTTLDEVHQKFTSFHPKFLRLLSLPLKTPILRWQVRVVPVLAAWTRGRTALLGDAAHGTLPTLGQGAAMAVEDAAALGYLLPFGVSREDVPARLEAYEKLRKERGEFVSRESVLNAVKPARGGEYFRCKIFYFYVFSLLGFGLR
ncbi:FAD/NAD(P)-binding domain-containing protein [Favolaschia claudopus]|uniref:FAD/NAD(P)-binding domain-containing protein n=1 Tax=Favolaschia claudopus TaxID=2862362 RepID=A0AAW0EEP8_9AGAR